MSMSHFQLRFRNVTIVVALLLFGSMPGVSHEVVDEFVARLARDSGESLVYERAGTLEVALDADQAERLAAASGALWREGVEARWVPAAMIPELEPGVTGAAAGALFIPIHGHIGVTGLTRAAQHRESRRLRRGKTSLRKNPTHVLCPSARQARLAQQRGQARCQNAPFSL